MIEQTKRTREELNIVPTFTTRLQAALTLNVSRKQIEVIARQLEADSKIRIGDCRNDKYYELIKDEALPNACKNT
ncbi:MAG: hypothetical protein IKJ08_07080 [Alistipes sp.]|nr:hypothetical protein [Alistipes sp.]